MTLARPIKFSTSKDPLVNGGQVLTDKMIKRLREFRIIGAYIEADFAEGVEVNEIISTEEKEEIAEDLKGVYNGFYEERNMSAKLVDDIFNVSDKLMNIVLSKDEFLLNVIDIKDYDNYTYSHSMYVGILSMLMGIKLGLKKGDISILTTAGLLHDIGKIDVPLDIIQKDGPLSDSERDIMKKHPEFGVKRLLRLSGIMSEIIGAVYSHHEKVDGTGYPQGLKGDDIPYFGRVIALADVFDALTSVRSYRNAWHANEVIEYMMGCANTHFDMGLLKTFLKVVAAYPVGVLVKLSDGSTALVIRNSDTNVLRPAVRILKPGPELEALGAKKGSEIDLNEDKDFLNITIKESLNEAGEKEFFDSGEFFNFSGEAKESEDEKEE